MSHFTVLVATKTADGLTEALAPYHEFACTGIDDEYVQDIDVTEDYRKEYEEDTISVVYVDGEPVCAWDDRFYRVATPEEKAIIESDKFLCGYGNIEGIEYRTFYNEGKKSVVKVLEYPENSQKVNIPFKEYKPFKWYIKEWIELRMVKFGEQPNLESKHKHGYFTVKENGEVDKIIDRKNPNAKWDWYTVGGRWSDKLILKNGTNADQAVKNDIDFDAMREKGENEERQKQEALRNLLAGREFKSSDEIEEDDRETRGKIYRGQESYKLVKDILLWESSDKYSSTKLADEEYCNKLIKEAGIKEIGTYAIVYDGKWLSRGEMGWFGMSSDEDEAWYDKYENLLAEIPDDYTLTIVDCHT